LNFLSRFEISQQTHTQSYSMHSAHEHSYYEMYYLMNGTCDFTIEDHTYRLDKGTILFVPMNVLHKTTYIESETHERAYIEFTLDYASDIVEVIGLKQFRHKLKDFIFRIPPELEQRVQQILFHIQAEHNGASVYAKCSQKLYFQQLLLLLFTQAENFPIYMGLTGLPAAQSSLTSNDAISQAMDYINHNFSKNLSLSDVASYVHLNASYFSKKFKAENGFGFKDYLNTVRINHSEKLLLETNKTITEIAFECGYDNSNYFGDAFKHLNHVSPSTFRKLKGNLQG